MRRSTSTRAPEAGSTSATSSRSELVPQSTAATLVIPAPPRSVLLGAVLLGAVPAGAVVGATHGPAVHQAGSAASASSPSGFTPGPAAREWATSTCRHLTRSGIPPAETPAISGTSPRRTAAQVVLVGRTVARGEVAVLAEPLGHLPHHTARLQRPDGAGRARTGEVEGRRERGAVLEPGRVVTTSGRPHGQRCATAAVPRAGRPSWARTASRSCACDRLARPGRHGIGVPARSQRRRRLRRRRAGADDRLPERAVPGVPCRGGTAAAALRGSAARGRGRVEPHVPDLSRIEHPEPGTRLRPDVRRVVPAVPLGLQPSHFRLQLHHLGAALGQLGALGEPGPHVGCDEQGQDHQDAGQHGHGPHDRRPPQATARRDGRRSLRPGRRAAGPRPARLTAGAGRDHGRVAERDGGGAGTTGGRRAGVPRAGVRGPVVRAVPGRRPAGPRAGQVVVAP